MKNLVLACAVLGTLMTANPANAALGTAWTGNRILQDCNDARAQKGKAEVFMEWISCYGYMRGLGDGFIASGACLPPRATTQQLVEVAMRWLKAHPEHRHKDAPPLMMEAWGEAWPCKEDDTKPTFKPM